MRVEEILADHEGGTTASLLVARLGVEGEGDQIALPWHVGCHLPHLATDGWPPV